MEKKFFGFVPNTITSLNVLSGSLSVVMAFEGNLVLAGLLILIAAVFDFFDGMSARLLNAYSPLGKELDSLADVISFGLAPAVILFQIVRLQLAPGLNLLDVSWGVKILLVIPFLLTIFSALRLAKFNIDTRQTDSFIGVPTPANAMIWASIPFIIKFNAGTALAYWFQNVALLLPLAVVMSLLLTSELPLFSLKFKNLKWQYNKTRFIFLGLCLILLATLQLAAFPFIILVYILASVVNNAVCKK